MNAIVPLSTSIVIAEPDNDIVELFELLCGLSSLELELDGFKLANRWSNSPLVTKSGLLVIRDQSMLLIAGVKVSNRSSNSSLVTKSGLPMISGQAIDEVTGPPEVDPDEGVPKYCFKNGYSRSASS